MGEVWVWSTFRDRAVEAFGCFAPVKDESDLLEAFQRQPVAVAAALDKVIDRFKAGKVRAPWRVWVLEVTSKGDVSVQVGPSRDMRVARARIWIDNAGCYCDRVSDVELELFGDTVVEPLVTADGRAITGAGTFLLGLWRGERALRDEMVAYWRKARERVEPDAPA